uniref:CONSTANS-like zinc finger protein n=1 Tax=Rhizophora mucronata TaxID=61149 RepID=A0A2P2LJL2_RHIMU
MHSRSQLCDACDACDASPVSIFCETERSVLCQNYDWGRQHLGSSPSHSRRPIERFADYPPATELVTILGFEDLGSKWTLLLGDERDGFSWFDLDGLDLDDGFCWFGIVQRLLVG